MKLIHYFFLILFGITAGLQAKLQDIFVASKDLVVDVGQIIKLPPRKHSKAFLSGMLYRYPAYTQTITQLDGVRNNYLRIFPNTIDVQATVYDKMQNRESNIISIPVYPETQTPPLRFIFFKKSNDSFSCTYQPVISEPNEKETLVPFHKSWFATAVYTLKDKIKNFLFS